jgi:GWxTD domain-containing protein
MKLLDGFGFFARAGKYLLELHIFDKSFRLISQDTLIVPDFSRSPSLSNLELASSVIADSSGGKFTKGNMRIIPNPDLSFGSAYQFLYAYYETYNLIPDTLPCELSYSILAENKLIVKSFPKEMKKKSGTSFGNTFALSIKGLKPGQYSLKLNLTDLSTRKKDSTEKSFWIVPKDTSLHTDTSITKNISYEQEIRFLATPTELSQYNSLNAVGKKEFLKKFWQKRNLEEFTNLVKLADNKYRQANLPGRDTDRGRILIKYGQPDEIEVHTLIEHTRSHEHWHYYAKGYHFIFIDIRGNNNFQLIYSNSDDEPKNPNWENYVDPLELEDLK